MNSVPKKKIRHSFHFACTPDEVINALTLEHKLQSWWTKDASVKNGKGVFEWKDKDWRVELAIEKSEAKQMVMWRCTKSNMQNTDAWVGSTMSFQFIPDAAGTKVDFAHFNYKDSTCYQVCLDGWKYFLGTSLKSYLETGKGYPYPETQDTNDAA